MPLLLSEKAELTSKILRQSRANDVIETKLIDDPCLVLDVSRDFVCSLVLLSSCFLFLFSIVQQPRSLLLHPPQCQQILVMERNPFVIRNVEPDDNGVAHCQDTQQDMQGLNAGTYVQYVLHLLGARGGTC